MWPPIVVVVSPWLEVLVSILRVRPVFDIGPLSERGLNKAFGFAVGSGRVGSGASVLDLPVEAGLTELSGSVTRSVVREQRAYLDAVACEELLGVV